MLPLSVLAPEALAAAQLQALHLVVPRLALHLHLALQTLHLCLPLAENTELVSFFLP
jgi:hypothetical protein